MTASRIFPPGSTVGVMGGGQLGRMFAIEARKMGYRIHTFSPDEDTPTGQLADLEIAASYEDETAVRRFARGLDVLTFEFENISAQSIEWASEHCEVRPSAGVLHICQHRLREKEFLAAGGFPLPRFAHIVSEASLREAVTAIGIPSVLKTASFGYDGKGQRKISATSDLAGAWAALGGADGVLEAWVPFSKEISVIAARAQTGELVTYPVCENAHSNHILDLTIVPANVPAETADQACALAAAVAEALGIVGLLAVEMFVLESGALLINELAPRPHNSGHFSFGACATSQFEQQLRAVCGMPLGSTELFRPVAMANLLGDLWDGGEPDWASALRHPGVKLHLYGKSDPRPGRKMGHLLALADDTSRATASVRSARSALARPTDGKRTESRSTNA